MIVADIEITKGDLTSIFLGVAGAFTLDQLIGQNPTKAMIDLTAVTICGAYIGITVKERLSNLCRNPR